MGNSQALAVRTTSGAGYILTPSRAFLAPGGAYDLSDATPQSHDVEGRDRLRQSLQRERAYLLGLDQILHVPRHPQGDEDLAGLGLAAQTRRQVGDRADRAVVPAALEADGADGRVALRDADPEVQLVPALAPPAQERRHAVTHRQRHPNGALGRVGHWNRVIEEDHHAVAGEALERALLLEDELAHLSVVLAQDAHDPLRLRGLRERGEPAKIEKGDRDFPAVGLERVVGAAGEDQLGELR